MSFEPERHELAIEPSYPSQDKYLFMITVPIGAFEASDRSWLTHNIGVGNYMLRTVNFVQPPVLVIYFTNEEEALLFKIARE